MNYIITWNAHKVDIGRSSQRYYIKHKTQTSVINITSATEINSAKVFDSHGQAKFTIKEMERHTAELGIIDIIEMTDKELFETRLRGK